MKNKITLALTLTSLLPFSQAVVAQSWGYGADNGPAHWGSFSSTCSQGKNQSPIDIETQSLTAAEMTPLEFDYSGAIDNVTNNGHTIQINVTGNNTLKLDQQTFSLKQFHFHTPSENTINGKHASLEAHFVHANDNGELAVVAVMYDIGKREDSALSALLNTLPANGQSIKVESDVRLEPLLPRVHNYYRYNGSLTTPPCSEGVRWIVLTDPQFIEQAPLDNLSGTMGNNARPTQPHNARLILK
ncbi:carbonic anhydrase [Vibrio barjaei]|uniref:carbonic anhydrase n=1 Tax=Vibrio barjaei TaxID=1676683 RepID=A0ABW7IP32_9VIBR